MLFLIPLCKFIPASRLESQFINEHYLHFSADPADLASHVSFPEAKCQPQCILFMSFTLFTLRANVQSPQSGLKPRGFYQSV